jgi:hypothetical protein
MRINRPDVQKILMSLHSTETVHAADEIASNERTVCGRDAYGWNASEQPFAKFIDSAYSCKRCVRILIG